MSELKTALPPGVAAMRAHRDKISIDFDTPHVDVTAAMAYLGKARDVVGVTFKTTTVVVEHAREHTTERVKLVLLKVLKPLLDTAAAEANGIPGAALDQVLRDINALLPPDLEIVIRKRT